MKVRLMIILLGVLVLPLVSSSIFIEPLNTVYNYGDQINVETKIVPNTNTNSYYTVNLKCSEEYNSNIYNSFYNLQANVEKPVAISTELIDPLLETVTSQCYLFATFGAEQVSSNSFSLSKLININAQAEFTALNPGETLRITGTATKESGSNVDGFIELFIPALNVYKSGVVSGGAFDISTTLPLNAKSGTHDFSIEIHNTDYSSRKINFGTYTSTLTVSQVLKNVEIKLTEENAKPESDFLFSVLALDQAGDVINKDVSLVVNKPKGVPFIEKVIKSGEEQKISFLLSDTPGYWSIEAEVDGIKARKLFYLAEVSSLQTSLIDNTLIVTNVGNAAYSGPIEVGIGSTVEVKQLNLGAGETKEYKLSAPDGDYSISILDQKGETKTLGNAFLTGNAIKVTDFREDFVYTFTNPLIWWLGLALLILVIVLVQVKIRMKRLSPRAPMASGMMTTTPMSSTINIPVKTLSPSPTKFDTQNQRSKFDMSWVNKPAAPIATTPNPFVNNAPKVNPASVFGQNGGIRERAVAIALYVTSNTPSTNQTMNRSLSMAQEVGAKVYLDGEYKIILFSPRLTRTPDNEASAINVARRIQALFLEHMRMYNDGAVFGIGVSDGEIISEIENGKFHFTSTGNLISYAKRLSHASNTKLLVSEGIRRKLISTVKTEKAPFQGVWEVVKVADRSNEFIQRFSDRNR